MIRKIIKYSLVYMMIFISFVTFFSTLGYYILVFDWSNEPSNLAINSGAFLLLVLASIAIYYVAEKIKSKI
ncbi:Uncharacterised protein [Serratia quinivorans]|nr:Uncharacterised protein [Serratia quinivorans]CAI0753175.1 Uncharacterised protein [Serratia quinivorans]CAI0774596.1 Uncharacterised protein [Serratia quinivorans]CAI1683087.1 Uncharacterised protein [Serratia quinivorans]CAI2055075.1 Uncharacterised protein [Serratia quinivorans]